VFEGATKVCTYRVEKKSPRNGSAAIKLHDGLEKNEVCVLLL
jgi:hypothetical protein